MTLNNLISIQFTEVELTQIDIALSSLEHVFAGKLVQLTHDESQRYGKLGPANENWVTMIYDDCQATQLKLVPDFVDKAEWTKDEVARHQLSKRVTRLETISQQIVDTNRAIGFDIYQTCLSVYNNTKFCTEQGVPGTKVYFDKWKAYFSGRGSSKKSPTT